MKRAGRRIPGGLPEYPVAASISRNRHSDAGRSDRGRPQRDRYYIDCCARYLVRPDDVLKALDVNVWRFRTVPQSEIEHAAVYGAAENGATIGVWGTEIAHRVAIQQIKLAVFIDANDQVSTRYHGGAGGQVRIHIGERLPIGWRKPIGQRHTGCR